VNTWILRSDIEQWIVQSNSNRRIGIAVRADCISSAFERTIRRGNDYEGQPTQAGKPHHHLYNGGFFHMSYSLHIYIFVYFVLVPVYCVRSCIFHGPLRALLVTPLSFQFPYYCKAKLLGVQLVIF
jgi:hypothetical protein